MIFHGATTTEGIKFSCKGLQRSRLSEHWQRYLRETGCVRNVSFRRFGNSVYTYAQTHRGLARLTNFFLLKTPRSSIVTASSSLW